MAFAQNFIETIGKTPLIKLKRASEATGCLILGKAEFMNPGGSVKDRAAWGIISEAEKEGRLDPGATIVEGTAGNTGIGLAMVGAARGYRVIIVIPETQSDEKKQMIRICGAELIEVPAVPYKDPNHYTHYAARLAEEKAKTEKKQVIWARQFDNQANRLIHEKMTAPEIWEQTDGKIDGFICAVGTGGTLAGMAAGMRALNKDIKIGLADPKGAALYSYYTRGVLEAEGDSISEGIGQGRITGNLEGLEVDYATVIEDGEALKIIFNLVAEEGLCLGLSSGINIAGAKKLAKEMGPGHTIVTILCDGGQRYASKIFNPEFLAEKNLPVPPWMERKT